MFRGLSDQSVKYVNLGFGDDAVNNNTLELMASAIRQSGKNPLVRDWAAKIVEGIPQKDEWGEADAIYHFVQNHSRYIKDPSNVEMLQSPLVALEYWRKGVLWQGDCDDMTILSLSLLKSIGFRVKLRAASYKPNKQLGHVYGLVYIYGQWLPVDEIKEGAYVGWENPTYTTLYDYEVDR